MARGGAASSRGRGKFKVSRGGGRHFSRDLDPRFRQPEDEGSSEEESSEEESDEEDEAAAQASETAALAPEMRALNLKLGNTEELADPEAEMSRAERKAMKKAQSSKKVQIQEPEDSGEEESSEDELLNPAKGMAKRQAEKAKAAKAAPAKSAELSRKEREAADKKAAAERYQKMHAQGKTAEAKSDLARLQEVRARREAAAKQREAEAVGEPFCPVAADGAEAAKEAEAKKASRTK